MKDNNWKQIVQMHGTLRLFCNLAIRKTPKGEALSAQEIDLMYHVALSKEAVTPGMLTSTMGISKTMITIPESIPMLSKIPLILPPI